MIREDLAFIKKELEKAYNISERTYLDGRFQKDLHRLNNMNKVQDKLIRAKNRIDEVNANIEYIALKQTIDLYFDPREIINLDEYSKLSTLKIMGNHEIVERDFNIIKQLLDDFLDIERRICGD